VADVIRHLGLVEGVEVAVDRHPLDELLQRLLLQLVLELGLAHENDLDQVMLLGLEVGEQTDFLDGHVGQVLGLVHDEDDPPAAGELLQQEGMQVRQQGGLVGAFDGQLILLADHPQKLARLDQRVVDDADLDVLRDLAQEVVDQRRLARSDFPRDDDEPLVLHDGVLEVNARHLVNAAHVEEVGVGIQVERLFLQPVEGLVHNPSASQPLYLL